MFMCEYNHTLDAKGRLIVPAKFRETLGDTFMVCKGLDHCLYVYSNEDWDTFAQQLAALPLTNKEARQFVRFFLSGASQVEVDKLGRILVPTTLRSFAELDKDVVLAGVGHRIEIWSKEKWDGESAAGDMDEIAETMDKLGITLTQ
ncbi:MAG: division/cell wall cluster transcriptional repressor MraZ [Lachnospiraceae bacterium]|nr:division/cell wall cluster transcriptional repressor MraZ [Lachnospiraceae bacterium]MBQ2099759.1 division/cell wall cluster transcriptional repressor MraZ [Lachnospiraceae bacterium]MBQ3907452.1 division/cell wall cluster transcriptional repressor MraZ [Lachnospiraceae bacterium]MCR4599154.1 division/cell wall cluster transcriptional repressor MraZ [Acetatifactor sp.]